MSVTMTAPTWVVIAALVFWVLASALGLASSILGIKLARLNREIAELKDRAS